MPSFRLTINGRERVLEDVDPSTPLLWVLRDSLALAGTKYGCGIGFCGTCTVHLGGEPVRSCSISLSDVADQPIVTIEGLAGEDGTLHPLQQAWIDLDVPQCGYCQAGQIMSAAALLKENLSPTDAEIDVAMEGNLCRCGTYIRIRKAIRQAAEQLRSGDVTEGGGA